GFNRVVFYNYYKNIYDIFSRIENEVMEEAGSFAKYIKNLITDNDFNENKLLPILDIYRKNEKYLKTLFTKEGNERFIYRLKKTIKDNIMASLKTKNKSADGILLDYYAEYYVSSQIHIIIYWFTKGRDITVEDLAIIIRTIANQGAGTILRKAFRGETID
ncbi:MAG: TetR family transcriptional regulator C-terminal domain-containing protein, partial [Mucispirillum sp.]|nr:TetR family transcriptional regulator C-terminal domain-containing protein [Mucispirillum sp.]